MSSRLAALDTLPVASLAESAEDVAWPTAKQVTLLLGAPRSGTSWVAKIFDSHPLVLYRHEPDIILRDTSFPAVLERAEMAQHRTAARAYLRRLFTVRAPKAAGSRPVFSKDFQIPGARPLRTGMSYGLRVAESIAPLQPLVRRVAIPDMIRPGSRDQVRVVVKSVVSGLRGRLYADALPGSRLVFVLRHPGGQVSSMLRGARLGKFDADVSASDLLGMEHARRYGLSSELYRRLPPLEQLTWNWVLFNERSVEDLEDAPGALVVRHDDLAGNPLHEARNLFRFAGLEWNAQTEEFVSRSSTYKGPDRYYKVLKDSASAVGRWREELSAEERARVSAIIRTTAIGQRWPDFQE